MRRLNGFRWLSLLLIVGFVVLLDVRRAAAQTLRDLNETLGEIEPQVSEGVGNPQVASQAIDRLDQAESDFSRIAEGGRVDQDALINTYDRLESMLTRMYQTYSNQKDACINTIDHGGTCDYEQPEQLALRALYPLSWLKFEGALIYKSQPSESRRLLNQAIDGFTDSTLVILSPDLVRENLLGRAYAERELGRFDRNEYNHAITDFRRIMKDGADTRQYRAAEQGLASTYAAMGRENEAEGLTGQLAEQENGPQRNGIEMLHLRELYRAEAVAPDASKRNQLRQQILDFIRARQSDRDAWAVAVAATAEYAGDPVAIFGGTNDGFQNWLLANVLYYKHQTLAAAQYYWAAAQSGKYPQAYKYAADLYYSQGRLEMVEKVVDEIAKQPGNHDAQWASYMRFKLPRIAWERGGKRSDALKNQWMNAADDYLKHYPHGQYAFEPRFRLAELLQQKGDYLGAAKQYEQVSGNPDYDFTARFNAAECYYHALGQQGAENKPGGPLPPQQLAAVRADAIRALRQAVAMEPNAERYAPLSQRRALHDSRGRGILMLVTLLQSEPSVNYTEVASLLNGYETQYPAMGTHFDQIFEWRIEALDHTAQYAELEREMNTFVAHDAPLNRSDYFKEIGLDFWQNSHTEQLDGNVNAAKEDAKLTSITYEYFERMANEGKIPAKNLTGTLSILGQAYLRQVDVEKADAIFEQVVKADPGSPDANAGLARIAQTRKNYRDALDLWSRVESVAAESDPLFYEAKYNMAEIFAEEGNIHSACNKLAVTRTEHPNLGSPGMKAQWGALQQRICENHTES